MNKKYLSCCVAALLIASHCLADDLVSAPAYKEVVPVSGWDRYTSDSATSISEWIRWWSYLRLKEPALMSWVDGLKIWIYPKNEICRSLYVRGIYDPNMAVLVNTFLPKDGVLLDIGSNMGYYSMLAAKRLDENGLIIAVEPSSRDYKRMVANIKENALESKIKTMMVAVGDRLGNKTIQIASEERNGLNTLGAEFSYKGIEKISTEMAIVTTIDTIVSSEGLSRVDVIKMDIEGSEVRALEGAKDTIAKYHPVLLIGVNSDALVKSKRSIRDLENILKEMNYSIYKQSKDSFGLEKTDTLVGIKGDVVVCKSNDDSLMPNFPIEKKIGCVEKIINFFKM